MSAVARAERNPSPRPATATAPLVMATPLLAVTLLLVWLVIRYYYDPRVSDAWREYTLTPQQPRPFGFIVSPFIHLHPYHLGVNLALLWLFGPPVERATGPLRFLALYLGAAWFAGLMHWAVATAFRIDLEQMAFGASGAVAGLMGVYAVRFPHVPLRVPFTEWRLPAVAAITAWGIMTFVLAVASAVIQVVGRVSHWAHVGGFVFGLGVAQLMGLHLQARREELAAAADQSAADGDFATASAAWSALLSLDPANVDIRDALVHARVALGDAIGAERLAREGIEQAARSGRRDVALFAYQSFHTVLPDLRLAPGVRCRIGNWWVEEGQFAAAYDTMLRAADEEASTPAAATALYRAGEIAADKLQDSRRARAAWQRVLLDYPDSPWRDTVHQRLRTLGAARPQR